MQVRPAPPRLAQGVQLSNGVGASLEFRDYQSYTTGDDLRRVDWNVYARTRHLFVRKFEHPTVVPVFILVDASESMMLEAPSRYFTAARMTAAICSAALSSQNPVSLSIADGRPVAFKRATQRQGLMRLLSELNKTKSSGAIGIASSLRAIQPHLSMRGRGVLVVISDFFEPEGVKSIIEALNMTSHRLVLVRVTQPFDLDLGEAADLELVDCESAAMLQVSLAPNAVRQYHDAYHEYFSALEQFISSRCATGVVVDASAETLPQLERLFPGAVLRL